MKQSYRTLSLFMTFLLTLSMLSGAAIATGEPALTDTGDLSVPAAETSSVSVSEEPVEEASAIPVPDEPEEPVFSTDDCRSDGDQTSLPAENKLLDLYIFGDTAYMEYDLSENSCALLYLYSQSSGSEFTTVSDYEGGYGKTLTLSLANRLVPGVTYKLDCCLLKNGSISVTDMFTFTAPARRVPTISVGKTVNAAENPVCCITPSLSGWYAVSAKNVILSMYDSSGNNLLSTGQASDDTFFVNLTGNKNYYISAEDFGDGSFSVNTYTKRTLSDAIHSVTATMSDADTILLTVEYSRSFTSTRDRMIIGFSELPEIIELELTGAADHRTVTYEIDALNAGMIPGVYTPCAEMSSFSGTSRTAVTKTGNRFLFSCEAMNFSENRRNDIENYGASLYSFTPAKTGMYTFTLTGNGTLALYDASTSSPVTAYPGRNAGMLTYNAELTAGKTYYIVIIKEGEGLSVFAQCRSSAAPENSITDISLTDTGNEVDITICYTAKFSKTGYEISFSISNTDKRDIYGYTSDTLYTETDNGTYTFTVPRDIFVPGASYTVHASLVDISSATALSKKSVLYIRPGYTPEKLIPDTPVQPALSNSWLPRMYKFTPSGEGDYLFSVKSGYCLLYTAAGSILGELDSSCLDEGILRLKAGESCYVSVTPEEYETTLTVSAFSEPEIYISVSETTVTPGSEISVVIYRRTTGHTGELSVTLGDPLDTTVILSDEAPAAELFYEIPQDAENGERIEFSVTEVTENNILTTKYAAASRVLTVDAHTPGDTNGDEETDLLDLVCLMRHLSGDNTTSCAPFSADINGDGNTNAADLVRLMRRLSGFIFRLY